MRNVLKRVGLLVAFTLPMLGSMTSTAHAVDVSAPAEVLVLAGHATVTPAIPLPPPVPNGAGTFTAPDNCPPPNGAPICVPPTCVVQSDPSALPADSGNLPVEPGTGLCSFTTRGGAYTNIICGTGFATGHITVTEAPGDTIDADFSITFVALQGVVVLSNISETDSGVTYTPGVGMSAGVIEILPDGSTPPGACTSGFNFVASAAIPELPTQP